MEYEYLKNWSESLVCYQKAVKVCKLHLGPDSSTTIMFTQHFDDAKLKVSNLPKQSRQSSVPPRRPQSITSRLQSRQSSVIQSNRKSLNSQRTLKPLKVPSSMNKKRSEAVLNTYNYDYGGPKTLDVKSNLPIPMRKTQLKGKALL